MPLSMTIPSLYALIDHLQEFRDKLIHQASQEMVAFGAPDGNPRFDTAYA